MIRVLREKNSKMLNLRGIAWDHPRGIDPLISASAEFNKRYQNVDITWDVRSLKEFGDMPIETLIEQYDLITIDHPYMGQADRDDLLLRLEDHISEIDLRKLDQESVGPSYNSYRYDDHVYALPIDAAALFAAYRKDHIAKTALSLPKTHDELRNFYKKLPTGYAVAWALCPTDFWCTFLTLCAQNGGRKFIDNGLVDKKIGGQALDEIKYHVEFLHPDSMHWNPIQILDRMGNDDEIIYAPYLFGYSNYSRKGYTKNLVHFTNSPRNKNHVSTILGGVGLAVSSNCQSPAVAASFVGFVASAEIQEGIFTLNGGQPGNKKAWLSVNNNKLCNNFFNETIDTLENAYVRPQHPGWNQFQERGADLIHAGVVRNTESEKIMDELNQLYQTVSLDG